jgi:hypothetical protein
MVFYMEYHDNVVYSKIHNKHVCYLKAYVTCENTINMIEELYCKLIWMRITELVDFCF